MCRLADAFSIGEGLPVSAVVSVPGEQRTVEHLVWRHGAAASDRATAGARDLETDVLATLHCLLENRNNLWSGEAECFKFWPEDMTEGNGTVGEAVASYATARTAAP
jgi:hypothetical protein